MVNLDGCSDRKVSDEHKRHVCSDQKVSDEHKKREISPKMKKLPCVVKVMLTALVLILSVMLLIYNPLSFVFYAMAWVLVILPVLSLTDDVRIILLGTIAISLSVLFTAIITIELLTFLTFEMLMFEVIGPGLIAFAVANIVICAIVFYWYG